MSFILFDKIAKNIENFLFPEKCIFCNESEKVCCDICREKIVVHINFKYDIYSVFDYRNYYVKELVHRLKYKHQK